MTRTEPRLSTDPTRRWLFSALMLYAVVAAAVAVGLSQLHSAARVRLEREMGARLTAVAATAAHLVDGDLVEGWRTPAFADPQLDRLREQLDAVLWEQGLSEVTLTMSDGTVVASAARRQERGELNVYWDLDRAAVEAARGGEPAAGSLTALGDGYQKSAHAPVRDVLGVVTAVVSVEAEADYFDTLAGLRRGAWTTAAIVLAVLTVIAVALTRLLRDIVRARARLADQEKLAAMGRMTAGIAHEIRNPLGIIRGAGELLALRLRQAGQDADSADYITGEVDRLDRILTRYLTFGQGGGLNPVPLDLTAVVRRTVRNLEEELAATPVRIGQEGDTRPVAGDDPSLQQVMINLLLNARDAARGADDPSIQVSLEYAPDVARVHVADRGAGLAGRDPELLFEPFETTKEKGSGLGLAVVRQVARDHGGEVRLADRSDGLGAIATLELPYDGPRAEE